MDTSKAKSLYDTLVESGELKKLYRSMSGNWNVDKIRFTKQYEDDQALVNDIYVDLDDIDEYYEGFETDI